ncbi:MAG TPA: hypothetical protein VN752_05330 [Solirubrobacterales bacterium]|nr:hypothetical protein [Solirubrobacterales bacterium]
MSPETLLLDKIEERTLPASRKSFEARPEDAVSLQEDLTPMPRVGSRPWGAVRQINAFAEGEASEEAGSGVQILFEERPVSRSQTPLRASLEALSQLRSSAATVDWLEAAAVLKRDVVRLRDTNYSRHAAVLLALADALTFTESAEVAAAGEGNTLFGHALGLLSEPYISEPDEEEFLSELLVAGWNLAPSEEQP